MYIHHVYSRTYIYTHTVVIIAIRYLGHGVINNIIILCMTACLCGSGGQSFFQQRVAVFSFMQSSLNNIYYNIKESWDAGQTINFRHHIGIYVYIINVNSFINASRTVMEHNNIYIIRNIHHIQTEKHNNLIRQS